VTPGHREDGDPVIFEAAAAGCPASLPLPPTLSIWRLDDGKGGNNLSLISGSSCSHRASHL